MDQPNYVQIQYVTLISNNATFYVYIWALKKVVS